MEFTISKNSPQKLGENENISLCGPQLHITFSTEFRSEPNSASGGQEYNPPRTSCCPETDIKMHHRRYNVAEDVSTYQKMCDLSTSATGFRLQDPSLTDQINLKPKLLECGSTDEKCNSEHSSSAFRRYEEILKPHECETCRKRFRTRTELKLHQRVHTREKPYECETCKKRFHTTAELKLHERVHTGDKPYECETCKKKFSSSSNLQKHERVHTGHKPYKCEICKKCFTQKSNLNTHLLTHTGERPFECEICHAKFKQKQHLTLHLSVHMVETPQEYTHI